MKFGILAGAAIAFSVAAGNVRAADPPSSDETKAQTDALNLQMLQANVAKAQADAQKAQTDAQTSKRTADAAGTKAVADALPNPSSGAVDVKAAAGQFEASLLAASAARTVAPKIADEVRTIVDAQATPPPSPAGACRIGVPPDATAGKAPVVIISNGTAAGFSHWEAFQVRGCQAQGLLRTALDNAEARAPAGVGPASVDVLVAGAVLSATTKLLATLTPNWEIGGITLTQDDSLLTAAFASDYVKHAAYPLIWPDRVAKRNASTEVVNVMTGLAKDSIKAHAYLDQLTKAKKTVADAKATAAQKAVAQRGGDALTPSEAELTAAIAAADALATSLNGDDKTGLPLNLVVQEKALADALGPNGLALGLHVQTAGGGYYTRKVIWNLFGGVPFNVSGGVIVSYSLVRPSDWRVVGGGVYGCYKPYGKLTDVSTAMTTAAVCMTN